MLFYVFFSTFLCHPANDVSTTLYGALRHLGVRRAWWWFANIVKFLYCNDQILRRKSGTIILSSIILSHLDLKKETKGARNKLETRSLVDSSSEAPSLSKNFVMWASSVSTVTFLQNSFRITCSTIFYTTNRMQLCVLLHDALKMLLSYSSTIVHYLFVTTSLAADFTFHVIKSCSFMQRFLVWRFSNSTKHSLWTPDATPAAVGAGSSFTPLPKPILVLCRVCCSSSSPSMGVGRAITLLWGCSFVEPRQDASV